MQGGRSAWVLSGREACNGASHLTEGQDGWHTSVIALPAHYTNRELSHKQLLYVSLRIRRPPTLERADSIIGHRKLYTMASRAQHAGTCTQCKCETFYIVYIQYM